MRKQFTLTEMIIVVTTLGILLSISIISFLNIKKESISSSMKQNISIIQNMVDTYYLKNEKYPIENTNALTLENPQLINIDTLLETGIQKKDLDLSKIKEQYYWVDVFGKVWGSTENSIENINLIEQEDGTHSLEWLIGKNYIGYNIYKTTGYSVASSKYNNLKADIEKNSSDKHYKIVSEYEVNVPKTSYATYKLDNKESTYLISMIDQYGLEAAPRGKFSNEKRFNPILKREGEYEFEIEGADTMYWIDFITSQETPGKSTIEYLFTVKDEEGNYLKSWTDDYFSLQSSKGIKVKVIMKGDDKGNKPSLYDLRIVFKYENDLGKKKVIAEPKESIEENSLCPKAIIPFNFSKDSNDLSKGEKGVLILPFKIHDLETLEETVIPKAKMSNALFKVLSQEFYISMDNSSYEKYISQETNGKCMVVAYEIEILSVKKEKPETIDNSLCGIGGSSTDIKNGKARIVYSIYLGKGEFLTKIERPLVSQGWVLKSISIETSKDKEPFKKAFSISEVKDESCVNIIYNYDYPLGYAPEMPSEAEIEKCIGSECQPLLCKENCIAMCVDCKEEVSENKSWCELNPEECKPQTCIEYKGECFPPPCLEKCLSGPPSKPEPNDKELQDKEWTTVDRIRFFGHGALNQLTRWYKAGHSDTIVNLENSDEISLSLNENTRIVYRYAKSSGSQWSQEYKDFTTTGIATSVMAIAYLQVKTKEIKNVSKDEYPTVENIKFYNEKGVLNLNMIKPTLVLIAKKDNNQNRDVYSNESNIEWSYEAADPRNKKIVDVEWSGDVRSKYPVGTYLIKTRVKNEVEIWSDWVEYELKILQEKPIAVISTNSVLNNDTFGLQEIINLSLKDSLDPDGDKIVSYEWKNKKDKYPLGTHVVSLRVQDSEGYWSDWVDKTITVLDYGFRLYRIEAEDNKKVSSTSTSYDVNSIVNNENASNKKERYISGTGSERSSGISMSYSFEGTGFDVKFRDANLTSIYVDNVLVSTLTKSGDYVFSMKSLTEGMHTLKIVVKGGGASKTYIDYIDVFGKNDTTDILSKYSRQVGSDGIESTFNSNLIETSLNIKSRTYYQLNKDSHVTIKVLSSDNKLVKTLLLNENKTGGTFDTHFIEWDGSNDKNGFAPTGLYNLEVSILGIEKKNKTTSLIPISVFNEIPSARIESEDGTKAIRSNNNTYDSIKVVADANYSNGAYLYMSYGGGERASNNNVKFSFVGDGFDLRLINPSAAKVLIDGVSPVVISRTGSYVYSVRNLENKAHTVQIYPNAKSNSVSVDYLDFYNPDDSVEISNITMKSIDSNDYESTVFSSFIDTRLNQKLKTNYTLSKSGTVSISVLDSNSKKVKTLTKDEFKTAGTLGKHFILWDGTNDNGNFLDSGEYKIQIKAVGVRGEHTTYNEASLTLFNQEPYLRVEAEGSTFVSRTNNNTYDSIKAIANPSASNGKEIYFSKGGGERASGNKVTFTANGTGFDIVGRDLKNIIITIDGVAQTFNKTGPFTHSVRSLPNKAHTIVLHASGLNTNGVVDYVDVYQ